MKLTFTKTGLELIPLDRFVSMIENMPDDRFQFIFCSEPTIEKRYDAIVDYNYSLNRSITADILTNELGFKKIQDIGGMTSFENEDCEIILSEIDNGYIVLTDIKSVSTRPIKKVFYVKDLLTI